ncbi:hypothetical protein GS421_17395 [Rhodococcus hoagii]|nr:hypothetical protein [Prescottella equi]
MSEQVDDRRSGRRDRSGHSQLRHQFISSVPGRSSPARSPPSSASRTNLLVKQTLSEPGNGGVLVVDGDASVTPPSSATSSPDAASPTAGRA